MSGIMRRVNWRNRGVVVEEVPWGDGKHQLPRAYYAFPGALGTQAFFEGNSRGVEWRRLPYSR
jgi:hypothetical protein